MQENHNQQELPAEGTAIATTISNIHQQEDFSFNNIRDLLQDDQMFRLDCDPTFFDSMNVEDNLNNNIGLEQIKDLETICSDSWIPAAGDIEIFSELPDSLFDSQDSMEKKEEETSPTSPMPAPPSPVIEPVEVKTENNSEFDLIKYIIFGEVCRNDDEIYCTVTNFSLSPQNADLLTPVEEKQAPNFDQQVQVQAFPVEIKSEPTPSTSAPSPQFTLIEDVENIKSVRRRAPKRRYSSDSDFSVGTSATSFNAAKRSSKKKRGRPAKELITDLPTIEDFSHMPPEHASHLVLRIKNNEASRKSRMKSKSKQTAMEDECDRLCNKRKKLQTKQNKLEGQIEILRQWLLGVK